MLFGLKGLLISDIQVSNTDECGVLVEKRDTSHKMAVTYF